MIKDIMLVSTQLDSYVVGKVGGKLCRLVSVVVCNKECFLAIRLTTSSLPYGVQIGTGTRHDTIQRILCRLRPNGFKPPLIRTIIALKRAKLL